jgi:hypothetical protein
MIGSQLAVVAMLASDRPLVYTVGPKRGEAPKAVGVAVAVVMFVLALWQYWVLTRPSVRRLFGVPAEPPAAPVRGGTG